MTEIDTIIKQYRSEHQQQAAAAHDDGGADVSPGGHEAGDKAAAASGRTALQLLLQIRDDDGKLLSHKQLQVTPVPIIFYLVS